MDSRTRVDLTLADLDYLLALVDYDIERNGESEDSRRVEFLLDSARMADFER